jgi:4-hydroxythreonine-4-phosphate dehydrogenase
MGEPAGIGPELLVRVAQTRFTGQLIALANRELLLAVASELGLPLTLKNIEWQNPSEQHEPGELWIEDVPLTERVDCGQLNRRNAKAVMGLLARASELAIAKTVDAIVTAPVHKAVLNSVDDSFLGHTEFFAQQAGVEKVVMMLATERLRVTLATTHISLANVPTAISKESLEQVLKVIHDSFIAYGLTLPKIAVCGLNPHAGEDGLLGHEDQTIVAAAIDTAKTHGIKAFGPFPADSLFTQSKRDQYDVFLAMYHDQGLPVVKAIGFGQSANITLGLPYIRTSVDHGTALDIADQFKASSSSLNYAINYAIDLATGTLPQ